MNCEAIHVDTEAVVEVFHGLVMWECAVEISNFQEHPKANRAYGWETREGKKARHTAVLHIPPVTSPHTAVRAAIVAETKR